MLAGGADALCRFVQRGFNVLRSLTRDAVRPGSTGAGAGLLLGEGAGLVVLERADAAARGGGTGLLGYLLGHASTADGATSPRRTRKGGGSSWQCARPWRKRDFRPDALDHGERARDGHGGERPRRDRRPEARPRARAPTVFQ